MAHRFIVALGLALALGLFGDSCAAQETPADPSPSDSAQSLWNEHLLPLFAEHCHECHGGAKQEGDLDLRSLAATLRGSGNGSVVSLDDPHNSPLWQVIQADAQNRMPPDAAPLSEDQRLLIERWLQALAESPEEAAQWSSPEASDPFAISDDQLPPADSDPTLIIDQLLAQAWTRDAITPAPLADDPTFVRRVYLDLLGRIPTAAERDEFLAQPNAERRAQLIDQLTEHPEHAQHLARVFDTVLLGRAKPRTLNERREQGWYDFLERSFQTNRPWNEVLRALVIARPDQAADAGAARFLFERDDRYQEIAEAVSPALFGVQIQCAQCHDHPLAAEIGQRHYWGLVAFFNRGKAQMTPQGPAVAESAIGGFSSFADLSGAAKPNLLEFLGRAPLAEERPADLTQPQDDSAELYQDPTGIEGQVEGLPRVPKFSRRQQFADHVLAEHPAVARAMVNRIWALLLGRGIVHPVDKIDSAHPAAHPELLAWLARDFQTHGYDVRRLIRMIAKSQAYALSAKRPSVDTAPSSFAYSLERPLSAESLRRSLAIGLFGKVDDRTQEIERSLSETFPDLFPEEIVTTLPQALYLSNHAQFNALLRPADGNLAQQTLQLEDSYSQVEQLYERLLGRAPAEEERAIATAFLDSKTDQREPSMTALIWSIVTSAEFRFNH